MNRLAVSALITIALTSVTPTIAFGGTNPPQATASNAGKITSPPVVQGTGDTWAEIDWTTFAGGDSTVKYGTDPAHLDQTAEGTANNAQGQYQHHSVRIQNLQPGTTYYFQASSSNGGPAATGQAPGTFTTKAAATGQPTNGQPATSDSSALKIINGPNVESTGSDSATVAWTTNTGGSSIVKYGTDANNLTQTAQSPYADNEGSANQTHRVKITHLQPSTTYYYMVDSGQGEGTGTEAKGAVAQFTTKAGNSQDSNNQESNNGKAGAVKIINGPNVESTGRDWATVAWTTNTGGSSVVRYGTDRNNLTQTAQAPYADKEGAAYQTHRVRITHLQPNKTYYFIVDSGQGEDTGSEAKSSVGQFTTKS